MIQIATQPTQQTKLRIRLLGGFQLSLDGDPIEIKQSQRIQALLTYLLLHRKVPQTRKHLAFLFWPDKSEAQAQSNLRNLLFQLRQALPTPDQLIEVQHASVQWIGEAHSEVDVLEFEAALRQVKAAVGDSQLLRTALTRAVAAYHGDLLPGHYDDWIVQEQERFRNLFLQAAQKLATLEEEAHNYPAAIEQLRRLLHLDPLREETYRDLMRLHALHGDRASALRVYHTCVTMLRRELEVEPDPATVELYERLMKSSEQGAIEMREENEEGKPALLPLIGRQEELRRLQATWKRAAQGQPAVLLLEGEAGLGKTRLAEELTQWVYRQGLSTLVTLCHDTERSLAFAPIINWLRTQPIQLVLESAASIWRAEIARLLPELRMRWPDLPAAEPLLESWQRNRFFEAIARVVLAVRQPLLLVVEDIHWCDDETIALIDYLLRFDGKARLLLLITGRSAEMSDHQPVQSWLSGLERSNRLTRLALEPLSEAETVALGEAVQGGLLAPTLRSDLFRESEGNPLFIVESVRAGGNGNEPAQRADAATNSQPAARLLPPAVHAVLQSRLQQLSTAGRELITLAAVIGRSFHFDLLLAASGKDEETLVRALDEAWQRQVVREQGVTAYQFSHDKLREVAYNSLSMAARRLLHGKIAHALAAQGAEPALLGHHYEQARQWPQAVQAWVAAGDRVSRFLAHSQALEHYNRALLAVDQIQPPALALRILVLGRRQRIQGHLMHLQSWRSDMNELEQLAIRTGDRPALLQALSERTVLQFYDAQFEVAVTTGQRAIQLAQELNDPISEARISSSLGLRMVNNSGNATQGIALIERGIHLLEQHEEPSALLAARCGVAFAYRLNGRAQQARREIEAALHLIDLHPELEGARGDVYHAMGANDMELAEWERAATTFRSAIESNRRSRKPVMATYGLMFNLAVVEACMGRYDEAVEIAQQDLQADLAAGFTDNQDEPNWTRSLLAQFHLDFGQNERAEALLQAMQPWMQSAPDGRPLLHALTTVGQFHLVRGDLQQAKTALQRAVQIWHLGRTTVITPLLLHARAAFALGEQVLGEESLTLAGARLNDSDSRRFMIPYHYTRYLLLHNRVDLQAAHAELMRQAALFSTGELRQSFLQNIPLHAWLTKQGLATIST